MLLCLLSVVNCRLAGASCLLPTERIQRERKAPRASVLSNKTEEGTSTQTKRQSVESKRRLVPLEVSPSPTLLLVLSFFLMLPCLLLHCCGCVVVPSLFVGVLGCCWCFGAVLVCCWCISAVCCLWIKFQLAACFTVKNEVGDWVLNWNSIRFPIHAQSTNKHMHRRNHLGLPTQRP